jgi:hypothetical protein
MGEAIPSPDFMQQNTLSSLIKKTNIVPWHCSVSPENIPESIVQKICHSPEDQPDERPALQPHFLATEWKQESILLSCL